MKTAIIFMFSVLSASYGAAQGGKIPSMPAAVSGNAVASLRNGTVVFSFMGVGPRKTWDDVTNQVYELRLQSGKWEEERIVPGVVGRVAASAVGLKSQVYLMGGYVLDKGGIADIVPDVNVYAPEAHRWFAGREMPTAVSNAVIGVNHDRFIYLVGGLSRTGPVNLVQLYDAETDTWTAATPMPGPAVFGHAGGLADDAIVYCDGAMRGETKGSLVVSDSCWQGKIDHKDPTKIEWSKIAAHPGNARFGISAGAGEKDRRVTFTGGSAIPFDFKGVNTSGQPAEPSPFTFTYDVHSGKWDIMSDDTFDPRLTAGGVLSTPLGEMVLGGMVKGQAVTARVTVLPKR